MGITFNGTGGEQAAAEFLKLSVVPLIEKNRNGEISMVRLMEALGLAKLPLKGVKKLVEGLKSRKNIIVTKGKDFRNEGMPISATLEVGKGLDEKFELDRIVSGRLSMSANRVLGLMDIQGFALGNSGVKWIKFIPRRGIYIRRSWTGNDYYIDWYFKPPYKAYALGIDDEVERLAGL